MLKQSNDMEEYTLKHIKTAQTEQNNQATEVESIVKGIIEDIKTNGDEALKKYEVKFGKSDRPFRVSEEEIENCLNTIDPEQKALIDTVVERISAFAETQYKHLTPFETQFGDGITMGQRIIPIETVGAYIPGGRFPLLSSGPMVVAPAKVAGAKRIVACSPANYKGGIHPAVLYGLIKAGATDIFAIGGAQAIAAMANGTESVPPVDMIAGPGNMFVAEAKKQVFGKVGIDLIAGPSEVLVFADESAKPGYIAADLLAQSEHDPFAKAVLVTTSEDIANESIKEVERLLGTFAEDSPAHQSWENMGEVILVDSIAEGLDYCNENANEHLHLHLTDSRSHVDQLHNYGSLFIGEESSVVFSDKVSGTNHTLPTNKAARYTGGLWVGSYLKVVTHQEITGEGTQLLAKHATKQSNIEGLEGHQLSAQVRIK